MNPRMRVQKLAFSWDIVSQKFKIKLGKQHRQTVCWHQFARDKWPVFSSGKANDEPTIQSCEDVDKPFQVEFIIWFSRITRRASSKLVCKTNHRHIYQQKPTKSLSDIFFTNFSSFLSSSPPNGSIVSEFFTRSTGSQRMDLLHWLQQPFVGPPYFVGPRPHFPKWRIPWVSCWETVYGDDDLVFIWYDDRFL